MSEQLAQRPYCVLCKSKEEDTKKLVSCASCFQTVCTRCCRYKTPIPYMGKQHRVRVCHRCIQCYSNCPPSYREPSLYTPILTVRVIPYYAEFAESQCCRDLYNHSIHFMERNCPTQRRFEQVGEYQMTPLWVPNEMVHQCERCGCSFSLFRRRHHCRVCGKIFCNNCSKNRVNLHEYGYSSKPLRVCDSCFSRSLRHSSISIDLLPFRAITTIASFLPIHSVFCLSQANKHLHRILFSKDFDLTFWRFRTLHAQNQIISLTDLLDENDKMAKHRVSFTTENETPTFQLSVSLSGSKRDLETSSMCLTDGCYWRLEYVRIVAFSGNLHCSFLFVRYPIISLRIQALKHLRAESMRQSVAVQNEIQNKEFMVSFIKCLQFGNSDILINQSISIEIQQLLLMTAGCLMNTTQTSRTISNVFRENEGITTILSLLRNDFLTTPIVSIVESTPQLTSSSFLTDRSSFSSVPGTIAERNSNLEGNTKKVVCYLVGILMNICKLDPACCQEVGQFQGIAILVHLIQLTQERLSVYCIECIRACCRHCNECKSQVGESGGLIKLINCYSSSNAQLVLSALNATSVILTKAPSIQHLFCLANGLNAIMQVEESWTGRCGVAAAKTISNLLDSPEMVAEFLHQRGLSRLHRLLLQQRYDLAGLLLGQLMNCSMYSEQSVYIQAPLLTSITDLLLLFARLAREHAIIPSELSSPEASSIQEHRNGIPEGSLSWHLSERNSSLSEDNRNSDLSGTMVKIGSSDTDISLTQLPVILGYGAGAICHLLRNEDNCQLMIDFKVDELFDEIAPYCDGQGKLFVFQAREIIKEQLLSGKCVQRSSALM